MNKFILFIFVVLLASCKSSVVTLKSHFDAGSVPPAPNYALVENWSALPTKVDAADSVPRKSTVRDEQAAAKVDVFFLHPTTYTYQPENQNEWNGDISDAKLNEKTDYSTILNQASIFNGSCRIFAPRYRQAHLYSFYAEDKNDGKQALDLAYQDLKAAFQYYLEHENNGRPIVIASHSQGTVHAVRLLKEFFDGKPLQKQLVEAYLIGRAVKPDEFTNIKPSNSPDDVGGFVSWNTYSKGYYPKLFDSYIKGSVSTNPLTWKIDSTYAPNTLNKGGVGLKFTMYPNLTDAQNHESMLWINRPHIAGSWLIKQKVWHIADMNFYWMNIRENVALRVEKFLK